MAVTHLFATPSPPLRLPTLTQTTSSTLGEQETGPNAPPYVGVGPSTENCTVWMTRVEE